ncbi:hypothetical protein ACQPYA_23330 [Micromonospora sp. CA-263727]|uniref:hypothetical protein n=1 Tax=Micromonospora sp. CA-263727 TaxID=3239967 RepID=UPI003D9440B8
MTTSEFLAREVRLALTSVGHDVSIDLRKLAGEKNLTDIWLELVEDVEAPEVLISHADGNPYCRIVAGEYAFEAVTTSRVPEFVRKLLTGDVSLVVERALLRKRLVLTVEVAGDDYSSNVPLTGDPLDGWEEQALQRGKRPES